MTDWPFEDAPNTATITTVHVLDGSKPVCLVTHDADDGGWQLLCGTSDDPDDARVVALRRVVALDPSLAQLADLPLGWQASRRGVGDPWHREPIASEHALSPVFHARHAVISQIREVAESRG